MAVAEAVMPGAAGSDDSLSSKGLSRRRGGAFKHTDVQSALLSTCPPSPAWPSFVRILTSWPLRRCFHAQGFRGLFLLTAVRRAFAKGTVRGWPFGGLPVFFLMLWLL